MDDLLEDDIKNSILHLQSIFPKNKLGKSLVTYEKTINFKTIADCLIFTEKQGIIGIEIKTAHDTLKRLSHQLDDYVKCCSYVYVYCHDWILVAYQMSSRFPMRRAKFSMTSQLFFSSNS